MLGIIAHKIGQTDDAVRMIADSLSISPKNAPALINLATIMKDEGRFEKAALFYQSALEITPRDTAALNNLGFVLSQSNRMEEAIRCFDRVLKLDPKSTSAWNYRGLAFQQSGQREKALECFRRGLAADPRSFLSLTNMGALLNSMGKFAEAERSCKSAIEIAADSELPHAVLAGVLRNLRRYPEAIDSCWCALRINPRSYLALCNLGNAMTDTGEHQQAVFCLRKAVELRPDDSMGHNNLGVALSRLDCFDEGIEHLRKAVAIDPNEAQQRLNLASVLYEAGRVEECLECFRKELEIRPDSATTFSQMLCCLDYLPHQPKELFAERLRFDRQYCEPLRKLVKTHRNTPDPRRRLRVGYVSADFRGHAVAHFIEPVLMHYSREQFEVFCYSNQWQKDDYTSRFRGYVDTWREVYMLSDNDLAEAIRADGIDILVDLSSHTAENRLPVFARKPAPVQVTMLGYMQTTGMSAIDYRLTDAVIDPVGEGDRLSSERLIRLPAGAGPFLFPRQDPPMEVNELPALKNGYVTFASFHNLAKINAEVVATWARVMQAVPDSKLMIVGRNAGYTGAALQAHGIGAERLEIFGRRPMKEYLELHQRADLVLDTFPFNGYTTNLLSAWMGLPFITVAGNSSISRVGESLLRIMELPELLAPNPDGYVKTAAEVAADLPRLAQWRTELRPRLEAWAGDGSVFTAQLEQAYREMWRRWCGQQAPEGVVPEEACAAAAL